MNFIPILMEIYDNWWITTYASLIESGKNHTKASSTMESVMEA